MNELICTNPKNYKLTLDKKYTVVIDEGETVMIVNDSNKTVRYYKDLFTEVEEEVIPEPEPVIVRTEQDLIDSITSDGTTTTYIDFNNEVVIISNQLQCLNNENSFSCGIKNIINIGDQLEDIYEKISDTAEIAEEDLHKLEESYNSTTKGYTRNDIMVEVEYEPRAAFMYVAQESFIDNHLKPYSWYVFHLLHGAMSADFPMEYVGMLQNVETIIDTNIQRACNENEVYA